MQGEVKESLRRQWNSQDALMLESKNQKARRRLRRLRALSESDTFVGLAFADEIELLSEGWGASLKSLAGKAFGKVASIVPDKAK